MECKNCEFKKSILSQKDLDIGAITAVCKKCEKPLRRDSVAYEILDGDFSEVSLEVLTIYCKVHSAERVSQIMNIPLEYVEQIIHRFKKFLVDVIEIYSEVHSVEKVSQIMNVSKENVEQIIYRFKKILADVIGIYSEVHSAEKVSQIMNVPKENVEIILRVFSELLES